MVRRTWRLGAVIAVLGGAVGLFGLSAPIAATTSIALLSVQTFAGLASDGDGLPATAATLSEITVLGMDAQQRLLIATRSGLVRRVEADGTLRTIAGTGVIGPPRAGPALTTPIPAPDFLVGLDDGSVLIATGRGGPFGRAFSVLRLRPDGTLERWLNSSPVDLVDSKWCQAYDSATELHLCNLSGMTRDPAGNVYLADDGVGQIMKVSAAGAITRIIGTGRNPNPPSYAPIPTDSASVIAPSNLVWANGSLWFVQRALVRVNPAGTFTVMTSVPTDRGGLGASTQSFVNIANTAAGEGLLMGSTPVFRYGVDGVARVVANNGLDDPEAGGAAATSFFGSYVVLAGSRDGTVYVASDSIVYAINTGVVRRVAGRRLPIDVPASEFPLTNSSGFSTLRIGGDGSPLYLNGGTLWRFEAGAFHRLNGSLSNLPGGPIEDGFPLLGRSSGIFGVAPGCGKDIYVWTFDGAFHVDASGIAHQVVDTSTGTRIGGPIGGECGAVYGVMNGNRVVRFGADERATFVRYLSDRSAFHLSGITADHSGGAYEAFGSTILHLAPDGTEIYLEGSYDGVAGVDASTAFGTDGNSLFLIGAGKPRTVVSGSTTRKTVPTDGTYQGEPLIIRSVATDTTGGLWVIDDRWLRRFDYGEPPTTTTTLAMPPTSAMNVPVVVGPPPTVPGTTLATTSTFVPATTTPPVSSTIRRQDSPSTVAPTTSAPRPPAPVTLGQIVITGARPRSIATLKSAGSAMRRAVASPTGRIVFVGLPDGSYTASWTNARGLHRTASALVCHGVARASVPAAAC